MIKILEGEAIKKKHINYDCKPFFCVKLVVPKLVKNLTYYGPREKGYGTSTEKITNPTNFIFILS